MKAIGVSEFKAHALKILRDVAETQEEVIVTKRGKPIVKISAYREADSEVKPGKLSHTLVFEKDIITPLGPDMWEAAR